MNTPAMQCRLSIRRMRLVFKAPSKALSKIKNNQLLFRILRPDRRSGFFIRVAIL